MWTATRGGIIFMETVVALLMFVNFEIKEHRIQSSMGMCLRGKREAERQFSESVTYKCIKSKAELETNIDGSVAIKKLILK
jgi:hypothetical protein